MNFDTAIFYDIENLTKGYRVSQQITNGLSLKEVLAQIRSIQGIGKPAVQRAYANWSDNRLWFFKNDLLELGIDPVQNFNFAATTYTRNIADIQLAVDVMDVMHRHPSIQNIVIVSGDGGYASLVKKLHEYGKTVIGCAYNNGTNKIFKAVCDHFVPLTDPDGTEKPVNGDEKVVQPLHSSQIWVRVKELANLLRDFPEYKTVLQASIYSSLFEMQEENRPVQERGDRAQDGLVLKEEPEPLPSEILKPVNGGRGADPDGNSVMLEQVRNQLPVLVKMNDWEKTLKTTGISLSLLKDSITKEIGVFDPVKFGFAKFSEFLRFLLRGTAFGVWQGSGSSPETKFGYRKHPLKGLSLLPNLEAREVHSVACYRAVLETGSPQFRLPEYNVLEMVAEHLHIHQPRQISYESILAQFTETAGAMGDKKDIKQALNCFLHAGCFSREPEQARLLEQIFTLKDEYKTGDNLLQQLKAEMQKKVLFALGDCRSAVFEKTLYVAEEKEAEKSVA